MKEEVTRDQIYILKNSVLELEFLLQKEEEVTRD